MAGVYGVDRMMKSKVCVMLFVERKLWSPKFDHDTNKVQILSPSQRAKKAKKTDIEDNGQGKGNGQIAHSGHMRVKASR